MQGMNMALAKLCKVNKIHSIFAGSASRASCRFVHYVQGQSPEPKIREYFYYIDHQGQLFLDDSKMKNFTSCFKEKKFLQFFFKRLKKNNLSRYQEFPFLSPCGPERNFVRCDDRPIVYTNIIHSNNPSERDRLSINGTGDLLTVEFEPEKICMLPQTGRVYYPASEKVGSVGLVKSIIAIDLSKYFEFGTGSEEDPPTHFTWKGQRYTLTNELIELVRLRDDQESASEM